MTKSTKAPTPQPGQVGTIKEKPISVIKSTDEQKRDGKVDTRKGAM